MRGYYGIFNEQICEIERIEAARNLKIVETSQTSVEKTNDHTRINIVLSNLDPNTQSNKELFDAMMEKIKEEQIKDLPLLEDRYRIYLEYEIIDNNKKVLLDGGTIFNDIKPVPYIFPLGLTADSEYVSRLVLSFNKLFRLKSNRKMQLGIMYTPIKNVSVIIHKIFIVEYIHDPNIPHFTKVTGGKDIDPIHDPHMYMECHGKHPSMIYNTETNAMELNRGDSIVIFDTEREGLRINPIKLTSYDRSIEFNISIDMNNYVIGADRDEVRNQILINREEIEDPADTNYSDNQISNMVDDILGGNGTPTDPEGEDNGDYRIVENPGTITSPVLEDDTIVNDAIDDILK